MDSDIHYLYMSEARIIVAIGFTKISLYDVASFHQFIIAGYCSTATVWICYMNGNKCMYKLLAIHN